VVYCQYHPDRPGIGICVRCRTVICRDCCTRLDGINHCHACLRAMGDRLEAAAGKGSGQMLATAGLLAVAWLIFFGSLWLAQGRWAP
jgi:hypothetical protein